MALTIWWYIFFPNFIFIMDLCSVNRSMKIISQERQLYMFVCRSNQQNNSRTANLIQESTDDDLSTETGKDKFRMHPAEIRAYTAKRVSFTCVLVEGSLVGNLTFNRPGDFVEVVTCDSTFEYANCKTLMPGYATVASTSSAYTMVIKSFDPIRDTGIWVCKDADENAAGGISITTVSPAYEILGNQLPSLNDSTLPITAAVVGSCTYPEPNCTWKYQIVSEEVRDIPTELTIRLYNKAPCTSDNIQVICAVRINDVPSEFAGKFLFLLIDISHPSSHTSFKPSKSPVMYFPFF